MATVNFQLIGSNVYCTFSNGKGNSFRRKSGFIANAGDFSQKQTKFSKSEKVKGRSYKVDLTSPTTAEGKVIKSKLEKLKDFINNQYNIDFAKGITINSDWLTQTIEMGTNQNPDESVFFSYHIQQYIDNAPTMKIAIKGGKYRVGMSTGRIKHYKRFKKMFGEFEVKQNRGNRIKVTDITKKTVEDFEKWMREKEYSENYIGTRISQIKAVLNSIEGINLNIDTRKNITIVAEEKEAEEIIYLSFNELKAIEETDLKFNYLINARKWLIIGCYTGQRVSDLMELSPDKISLLNDRKVFRIKQKKTGTKVTIPILPKVEQIINEGFPHKISHVKLNKYFKEVCREAKINKLTKGRIREEKKIITTKGVYPKWKLIGTHVCRRSFATNFYGNFNTSILKHITGHATESMFLKYIGKSEEDYIEQFFSQMEKLPKTNHLRLIKTGTDE